MDHQENQDFMRECKCKAKRILSKKMKWARIPDEFQYEGKVKIGETFQK